MMLQIHFRIANPSGKLCIARPILTIIPVFNKDLLPVYFLLSENFFSTSKSHIIITITPNITPIKIFIIELISRASGISSKHIIAVIKPDAKDSIKLKNLLLVFLKEVPIIPPSVVPNVPKNKPTKVVFKISFKLITLIIYIIHLFFYS